MHFCVHWYVDFFFSFDSNNGKQIAKIIENTYIYERKYANALCSRFFTPNLFHILDGVLAQIYFLTLQKYNEKI